MWVGDSFGDSYRLSELPSLFDQNLFKSFPPRPLDWMESSCNLHPDKAAATQTWNLSNILQPTQFQEFPAPAASTSSSSCSFIVFFLQLSRRSSCPWWNCSTLIFALLHIFNMVEIEGRDLINSVLRSRRRKIVNVFAIRPCRCCYLWSALWERQIKTKHFKNRHCCNMNSISTDRSSLPDTIYPAGWVMRDEHWRTCRSASTCLGRASAIFLPLFRQKHRRKSVECLWVPGWLLD